MVVIVLTRRVSVFFKPKTDIPIAMDNAFSFLLMTKVRGLERVNAFIRYASVDTGEPLTVCTSITRRRASVAPVCTLSPLRQTLNTTAHRRVALGLYVFIGNDRRPSLLGWRLRRPAVGESGVIVQTRKIRHAQY